MKRLLISIGLTLLYQISIAQWNSLTSVTANVDRSAYFSVNGKGYILGGSYSPNMYSFDPSIGVGGTWTSVTSYPTGDNDGAVACALNGIGYAGMGAGSSYAYTSNFFKYDPSLGAGGTWAVLTNFPGAARAFGVTFALMGKVYMGGGLSSTATSATPYNDFYCYDPGSNTWTAVASCPALGVSCTPVAFAIGDTAYLGTGGQLNASYQAVPQNDFYKYDPSTGVGGTWTKIASLPGSVRLGASAFSTCDKGYVGLGYTNTSQTNAADDFWQYDPTTGKWTSIENFVGAARGMACSFMIGKTGYVCSGFSTTGTFYQDLWSYTPPALFKAGSTTVCTGTSAIFTDTTDLFTPTNWQWTFPGGMPATSNIENPTVSYATAGNYNVSLITWNGCDSGSTTYTSYISVMAEPLVILSPALPAICSGENITLLASGGTSYQWTGTTNTTDSAKVNPISNTTYSVQVSNGTCSIDTSITVAVTPVPLPTISSTQSLCAGGSVPLLAGGGTTYTWTPNTGLSSTTIDNPVATPTNTTTYTVTIANGSCQATDNVTVTVNPLPVVAALGTATILIGDNTPLTVSPVSAGDTYQWSPGATLSCNTCANPVATPTATTWYHVIVNNSSNCNIDDSVEVTIKELCGPVYIPNAFSPNGDGSNDVLNVMGNCIQSLDLIIYDRWGNKVFETTNPTLGWDGSFKGKQMNTGTYVYSVQVTDLENNTVSKKGNITLIR